MDKTFEERLADIQGKMILIRSMDRWWKGISWERDLTSRRSVSSPVLVY